MAKFSVASRVEFYRFFPSRVKAPNGSIYERTDHWVKNTIAVRYCRYRSRLTGKIAYLKPGESQLREVKSVEVDDGMTVCVPGRLLK